MKSASENVHYFSAYPLKALNLPEEEYQHEVMNRNITTIKTSRIRTFPMANPYREQDFLHEVQRKDSPVDGFDRPSK